MTLSDILRDCSDVAVVCVCDSGIEHAYIGADDIAAIDQDILDAPVDSYIVVKRVDGLWVFVEV
jgi:hypothetical protein